MLRTGVAIKCLDVARAPFLIARRNGTLSPLSHLRAFGLLTQSGFDPSSAAAILTLLEEAGMSLADRTQGDFVCRWVDVLARPTPPNVDTIIRTITRTSGAR